MKRFFLLSLLITLLLQAGEISAQQITYSVKKIRDNGQHCAFTSLERFNGRYYCAFREGETHVFDSRGNAEGKVCILSSDNGDDWEESALIGKAGYDLRDPKLSVTPDGRLMVIIGGSIYRDRTLKGCVPHVMFSSDGRTFTDPQPVVIDPQASTGYDWIWRVTWYGDTGYGISYSKSNDDTPLLWLLKTTDGVNYKLVTSLNITGMPNEATVRMLPDGRMAAMVRRESDDAMGYWGISEAPYTDWKWRPMEFRLGGPDFIVLDDQRIVAGSRSYYIASAPKTALYIGGNDGRFSERLLLPSGGDTSYPSFLKVGNELWVSYYSMHETPNASIYLAKIPLDMLKR